MMGLPIWCNITPPRTTTMVSTMRFQNECHDDNRVDAQRADDLFVSRGMREYNRYYVIHGHMY